MQTRGARAQDQGWTRGRLLRGAAAVGAAGAAAAALGARGDAGGITYAAPSDAVDADVLNLMLVLERVQEAFYRAALERGHLSGELLEYARVVGAQEQQHATLISERLGGRARAAAVTGFDGDVDTPERFRQAAIDLEEAAIAAYIGQGANLTAETMSFVATLTSVEARQVAWVRDIAGVLPAPHAADPARKAEDVLADLRRRGYLR